MVVRNIQKSYRDFYIYFFTLSFSVCLFYSFNSFYGQQHILALQSSNEDIMTQLSVIMALLSCFVSLILCFLMLYANNYLIKRRKKEFGLYMLLGMPKRQINRILLWETMIIGFISLGTGIVFGVFMSQVLMALTANLFEVALQYHFVFSWYALFLTIGFFSVIFFILMIFNFFHLNHYKLVDLLSEQKIKNDKVRSPWFTFILFLLSLGCLAYAYAIALHDPLEGFAHLETIILLGSMGTLLFFTAFSGFLQFCIQKQKIYLRDLNLIVLRQLNYHIHANTISMSITCIMLLLSIGALATCLNIKQSLNQSMKTTIPYDFSLEAPHLYSQGTPANAQDYDLKKQIDSLHLSPAYIKSISYLTTYLERIKVPEDMANRIQGMLDGNQLSVNIIPLSSYNQVMKDNDHPVIDLLDNQVYLYNDNEFFHSLLRPMLQEQPKIEMDGKTFQIIDKEYDSYAMYTSVYSKQGITNLVVPDHLVPVDAQKYKSICNVKLTSAITPLAFQEYVSQRIEDKYGGEQDDFSYDMLMFNAETLSINTHGVSVIVTYIGIYLGSVFLISSAAILALHQLSQASENRKNYQILQKLGAEQKMINRSLLLQLGIYFLLPLGLAIIHSIVGIQMISQLALIYGKGNILLASLWTGGGFLILYGFYYVFTYMNYKSILLQKEFR